MHCHLAPSPSSRNTLVIILSSTPGNSPKDVSKVTLHGFSDSSGRAYGAVYYVRRESKDGHIHVAIVCAKSHVVPLKDVEACHMDSTLRLELQAARLSARMRATIEQETGVLMKL